RRRFVHSHALDEHGADRVRRLLRRDRPEMVVGYGSALDRVASVDEPLERPPRAVVAAAEIFYPSQRRRIERFFRAPVFERYGCNEFAALALQCSRGAMHVNLDRVALEILRQDGTSAGPGKIGDARVTDLDNHGMPL